MRTSTIGLIGLASFLTLGTACGGEVRRTGTTGGSQSAKVQPTASEAEAAAAADEEAEEEALAYSYNPIGKRDPFRSFFAKGPDPISSPTPLQRFEVDQYVIVGVVTGIDRPRAMFQDPENQGHVVELGTYIGKNWGKITSIDPTSVTITEEYQNITGELVTTQIVLELPEEAQ